MREWFSHAVIQTFISPRCALSQTEVFSCCMKLPHQKQSLLVPTLKVLLLIAIVGWVLLRFPEKDWKTLLTQHKDWRLLALALAATLMAHLISFWRWRSLVNALGVPMTLVEATRLGFLGSTLNMVSVGSVGGDVFKAIAAARRTQHKRAEVVTSVLVDRAVGLLGLVMVAAISLSLAPQLSDTMHWIRGGAFLMSAVGLVFLVLVMLVGHWLPVHRLQQIPGVGRVLYRVGHACLIFHGRPYLVCLMLISSLLVHTFLTTACWLISNALYASDPSAIPSLAQHFQAIPPAMAAATLPLTPGGVGVQEVLIQSFFLELPGISPQFSGLVIATMYRAILIVVAILGGVVYVTGQERQWVTSDETAPLKSPSVPD